MITRSAARATTTPGISMIEKLKKENEELQAKVKAMKVAAFFLLVCTKGSLTL